MRNRRWSQWTKQSKAFTLIEILIVVVILGILAAIVVPQFTKASEDAQVGNVQTQLQTIRSQIELYRVKNNASYPTLNVGGAAPNFGWDALIGADYMRSAPVNPRTNSATIAAAAAPGVGWIYDAATGQISAAYFDEVAATDGDPATPAWTGP
jgi:general secretion pathway protein G